MIFPPYTPRDQSPDIVEPRNESLLLEGVVPTGTEDPGSPPDGVDLEPLPRLARHRPGK
jgi:hypothetical protein